MAIPTTYAIILASIIVLIVLIALSYKIILYIISSKKVKILIKLQKYNYSPGETINGSVYLKIKEQLKAKEISIRFVGEKTYTEFIRGKSIPESRTTYIFDFKQPLLMDKDLDIKEYNYDFSIKIPIDLKENLLEKTATGILNSMQMITGKSSIVKWYLIAELKGEGLMDLATQVDINLA